jgi:hypothetical protein
MNIAEQLKQALADADSTGSSAGWIPLVREAFAEIDRLQTENIDMRLKLIAEDQIWQDRRRFDLFFAAAITGFTSRRRRRRHSQYSTADDIAHNAARVAVAAMEHKLPFSSNPPTDKASTGV